MSITIAQHTAASGWYLELVRGDTRTYCGPYESHGEAARQAALAYRFAPGAPTSVAVMQRPKLGAAQPDARWYLYGERTDGICCISGPFTSCTAAADHVFALRAAVPGIAPDGEFSLHWACVATPAST